jgi:hypothetical protein
MGMGVQSVTIAAMACLGDLPMPDVAIFADPGWESRATYRYAKTFTLWAKDRGLDIITVSKGNIRSDSVGSQKRFASMPFHTLLDGEPGMLRRQCTNEYKIQPVIQATRRFLKVGKGERVKKSQAVTMWLGISLDEVQRMKESRLKWITNAWPLIDKKMRRGDCLAYLKSKGIPAPEKSSCVGCPFHGDSYWRDLKKNSPEEFESAANFDDIMRTHRVSIKSKVYLHPSLKPLREIDFTDNQGDMFINECEGHCGL